MGLGLRSVGSTRAHTPDGTIRRRARRGQGTAPPSRPGQGGHWSLSSRGMLLLNREGSGPEDEEPAHAVLHDAI
jgi:hypothetical protein